MKNIHILFARLIFEPNLSDWTMNKTERTQAQVNSLLKIISYQFNPNEVILRKINQQRANLKRVLKVQFRRDSRYYEKNTWKFGGINSNNNQISGKLAKKTGLDINLENDEIEDFTSETIESSNYCRFVIDLENHILCFENKKNVGELSPLCVIQDAFNAYFDGSEKIQINLINDRRKISEKIQQFKRITRIKLNLSITNPNSTPISKRMDDSLRSMRIRKMEINATSFDGLDMEAEEGYLKSGLALAEEGYGTAQVIGVVSKNGKDSEISMRSYNLPYHEAVDISNKSEEQIFNLYLKKISEVNKNMSDKPDAN